MRYSVSKEAIEALLTKVGQMPFVEVANLIQSVTKDLRPIEDDDDDDGHNGTDRRGPPDMARAFDNAALNG